MPSRSLPQPQAGAYELKFLLPNPLAEDLLCAARERLAPDPHAEAGWGDGYRIHSLYFDTRDLAVYHRMGPHARRKLRLRRYGAEPLVYTERKTKLRGLVTKRRTAIAVEELPWLHEPRGRLAWPGRWFSRRLALRGLAPAVAVYYERTARVGMTSEGPIRLTVDRNLRCAAAEDLAIPDAEQGLPLLVGQSIVELKFRVALPAVFKDLIRLLVLEPVRVSKYRRAAVACGLIDRWESARPGREDTLAAKLRTA